MSKILITSLGGKKKGASYKPAIYEIDGVTYKERTFIASVLQEHYKINKTIFIGTAGSMWENVYDYYCEKFAIDKEEGYFCELAETIEEATKETEPSKINIKKFNEIFSGKIKGIVTKYGVNETEIFENFNLIMQIQDEMKDGDELYLDITHSFRSNAFWMFLVMNYLNDVSDKKVEIKAISYGMLDAMENNIAPIVDLLAFYKILKWIKGASSLKEYGNSYLLLEDINNNEVRKKLKYFSDSMNINYIGSLRKSIIELKKIENQINSLKGPASLLIPRAAREFLQEFSTEDKDYIFQAKLAKWHFKEKRYAMAVINLNEAVVNFVMNSLNLPEYKSENTNDERKFAKDWLFKVLKKEKKNGYKPIDKDLHEYGKMFEKTRKLRNDIAHSLGEKADVISDINVIGNYCERILDLLNEAEYVKELDEKFKISETILEKKGGTCKR